MLNCQVLTEKLLQINQSIYFLMFQPMYRYFKQITGIGSGDYIYYWKSRGLSDKNITAPSAPNNFLNLSLEYLDTKERVRFK